MELIVLLNFILDVDIVNQNSMEEVVGLCLESMKLTTPFCMMTMGERILIFTLIHRKGCTWLMILFSIYLCVCNLDLSKTLTTDKSQLHKADPNQPVFTVIVEPSGQVKFVQCLPTPQATATMPSTTGTITKYVNLVKIRIKKGVKFKRCIWY